MPKTCPDSEIHLLANYGPLLINKGKRQWKYYLMASNRIKESKALATKLFHLYFYLCYINTTYCRISNHLNLSIILCAISGIFLYSSLILFIFLVHATWHLTHRTIQYVRFRSHPFNILRAFNIFFFSWWHNLRMAAETMAYILYQCVLRLLVEKNIKYASIK